MITIALMIIYTYLPGFDFPWPNKNNNNRQIECQSMIVNVPALSDYPYK